MLREVRQSVRPLDYEQVDGTSPASQVPAPVVVLPASRVLSLQGLLQQQSKAPHVESAQRLKLKLLNADGFC